MQFFSRQWQSSALAVAVGFMMISTGWCEATKPVQTPFVLDTGTQALNITNDIAVAEAQANAYPEDPEAQFLLAIAYSRSPYLEQAVKTIQKTKKMVKRHPEGYAVLDRLMGEYQDMLSYRSQDPLIYYRLAFGYYLKGYGIEKGYIKKPESSATSYYDKAEAAMKRVISLDPGDIWARNYLGFLMVERQPQQNLDSAIRIWEDSIQVNPTNPVALLMLGEASLKKGNLKQAVQYANRGLAVKAEMTGTPPEPLP